MTNIIARFKEPSSYSAISAVLAMCGIMVPSDLWQSIVMLGCGASGIAGFGLEKKRNRYYGYT